MENINSLLSILHNQKGQELKMDVGHRIKLITGAGTFDMSQTPLTQGDVGSTIAPIIPDPVRNLLATQSEIEFNYECPGVGNFGVKVRRLTGGLSVSFAPGAVASPAVPGQPQLRMTTTSPAAQPFVRNSTAPLTSPRPNGQATTVTRPPSGALASTSPSKMDDLFRAMVAAGASDLHLSSNMPPLIRKDGQMVPLTDTYPALDSTAMKQLLASIMPQKNREEFERRNDTDFAYEIADLARFRANIFRDRKGMGGVFRVIPNKILSAEDLGLSQAILKLCHLNKGLVLVTGPTGSGKSTTLCAMIDYINRNRTDHIITIEDPIEFVHENKKCLINQREVHNHTTSFKDALRAALREDPDIVLVGEMRDLETVAIAIETAETGHLVFGTLHTTTAASTVDRIIDQFPPDRQTQIRIMLSESLRGVISQTLLRKKGGGRVAALEVLIVNPAISNLIREAKTFQIPSMMQTNRGNGNVMLNDALMDLVSKKLVEPDEAYAKAVDKATFESMLKRNNVDTKFLTKPAQG
ncbi:MAG: type IV pilus twitching motility protein PilT [Acidobacteriota bacterium]